MISISNTYQPKINSLKRKSVSFGMNKKIFVCSPVTLGIKEVKSKLLQNKIINKNIKLAEGYCRKIMLNGDFPYAPHLIATRFTNEHNPAERQMGINIGLAFLKICDALCVFSKTGKFGKGMEKEMQEASKNHIPVIFVKESKNCPEKYFKQFGKENNIDIKIILDNQLGKIDKIINQAKKSLS